MGRTGAQSMAYAHKNSFQLGAGPKLRRPSYWCVSTLGRDDLLVSFSVRMSAPKERRFQQLYVTRNGSNKLIRRVCASGEKFWCATKNLTLTKRVYWSQISYSASHTARWWWCMTLFHLGQALTPLPTPSAYPCWCTRSGANSPVAKIETVLIWD